MIFKNSKTYNVLKYLSLVVFDALGLAYEQLAEVWNLPYGTEVMRTCVIVSTLIGALIGLSSHKFNSLEVNEERAELDKTVLEERDEE